MASLTPRGKALRYFSRRRRWGEQPHGSNCDRRKDGIRAAQLACASGGTWLLNQPWCGVACFAALKAAGVKGITSRMASVALIEDDAKHHRAPFGRGWTTDPGNDVLRGDLVILFGRGVHVGQVREIDHKRRIVFTAEGNTSPGVRGSQDDGGGYYFRARPFSAVRGFAKVNFPDS